MSENHYTGKIKQFVALVCWDIILDWKSSEIMHYRLSKNEQLKPYAYGTGARGISKKVFPGNILWILSIPTYGKYASFPTIVAMLIVEEIIDQLTETDNEKLDCIPGYIKKHWNPNTKKGWRYVIIGNRDKSKYFPINNSYKIVVNNILNEKSGIIEKQINGKHYRIIARYFQRMREIPEELLDEMLVHKDSITKSATVFISYRHYQGKIIRDTIVKSLLMEGINCWLDINRMAQKVPKDYEETAKKYFEQEIENAISECKVFIAQISDSYLNSEWTKLEYSLANKISKESGKLSIIEISYKTVKSKIKSEKDAIPLLNSIKSKL